MSWAHWDLIEGRRLLVLVCAWTVQVWDTTDLDALRQLATMDCDDRLVCAQVVRHDSLGVLLPSSLLVYSLSTHILLHRIRFPGVASALQSSPHFIVVTTTTGIHVLSAVSFHLLWSFALADPIFALSGRLLAYANAHVNASTVASTASTLASTATASTSTPAPHHVTVLDLFPLLDHTTPLHIAHFLTSHTQPIARLAFSHDGCSLLSVPRNGQVVRVFSLRPLLRIYDLRRGRTSGIVHHVHCARDGRWVAIGTRNRTLHLFPINPHGGPPHVHSHLSGKVTNPQPRPQPHPVQVNPLVRLRPLSTAKSVPQLPPPPPLAFTFVSPPHPGNGQDLLVFDPADRVLSLRRITLHQRPKVPLSGFAAAVVSRSLPSPMAPLPPSPSAIPSQEAIVNWVGTSHVVATWSLQNNHHGAQGLDKTTPKLHNPSCTNWLAQAELSTCSPEPRSLYLSHQFTFWSLKQDYHALLRQYKFHHLQANKIHVRPQVQMSIMGSEWDPFVGDTPPPLRLPDEPFTRGLSSALSGDLLTARSLPPPLLPAFPNGIRGTGSSSPTTGMTDGLGRLRREISSSYRYYYHHRTRSHQQQEEGVSAVSVPLEFDEEDEDEDLWSMAVQEGADHQRRDGAGEWDDISVVGLLDEEYQLVREKEMMLRRM